MPVCVNVGWYVKCAREVVFMNRSVSVSACGGLFVVPRVGL